MTPRTALVALAARRVGQPVKLVTTRDQGFTVAHLPRRDAPPYPLGASRDGKLTALLHEGWEVYIPRRRLQVAGTDATARLYAARTYGPRSTSSAPTATRPASCARRRRCPMFTRSRAHRRAGRQARNGPRRAAPRQRHHDRADQGPALHEPLPDAVLRRGCGLWLVGAQPAAGVHARRRLAGRLGLRHGDLSGPDGASGRRVRLSAEGKVRVQTAAHEIGTGAYTVIGQAAADAAWRAARQCVVELGDSSLPPAPSPAARTRQPASPCAVAQACDAIRPKLGCGPAEPWAVTTWRSALKQRARPARSEEYAEWVPDGVPATALKDLYKGKATITGGTRLKDRIQFAFGAEFVEVQCPRAHARNPRAAYRGRVRGGHIVNPRTARSQLMGGMIWGIGSALHEATEMDTAAARYINDNLADYLVAVNADIDQLEVILVPEQDDRVNPAGIKGVGELGNVGTAAAIANAVYHATGKRIRQLPIRLEKLLEASARARPLWATRHAGLCLVALR